MLSLKFTRIGKKNRPEFRLIAIDKQKDPWGKAVEILGNRNPRTKENNFKVERIQYWLEKGAQATDSVWNVLVDMKIVEGKKRTASSLTKKRSDKMAKESADKKAKEEEAVAKAEEAKKAAEAPTTEETTPEETPAAE